MGEDDLAACMGRFLHVCPGLNKVLCDSGVTRLSLCCFGSRGVRSDS